MVCWLRIQHKFNSVDLKIPCPNHLGVFTRHNTLALLLCLTSAQLYGRVSQKPRLEGAVSHRIRCWRNISNLNVMTPPLWRVRKLKSLLIVKRREMKSRLLAQHWKLKIMASGYIASWQMSGNIGKSVRLLYSGLQKSFLCRWWLHSHWN